MLSHRNLASNALATLAAFPQQDADVRLCWLPLSHIYARTSDLYTWIAGHGTLVLAKSRDTILADCQTVQPTLINGVPYFYDKVCRHLCDTGKADERGALQELLGGRMRCCCAGGAALPDHVARFFSDRGLPLVQGYGLTESSPVITADTPRTQRIGTVGPPIPGVEVRIADDGEILTRGPHVMVGYWNQPRATAATIKDGWLHTGDIGVLDDGHLRITGRKKELIVTASGKNVAPTLLEGLLTQNPLVSQAIVFGDSRNYLTALIVPNRDPLRAAIIERRIPVTSPAEALVHPLVLELYRAAIDNALRDLSHCEQIGRFTLIGRGFTIESGELTPTLKLRREVIARNFSVEIAAMYAEPGRSAAECGV
jgi:long-chain acyl-CoA synthetase